MALPSSWVDRIFDKLTLTYGHLFLGRWSGLDMQQVKADWAHELEPLRNSPHAIRYALENLPTEPPTVLQFRALCGKAPQPRALPAPQVDAEFVGEVLQRLHAARPMADPLQTPAQRCFVRILQEVERNHGRWTTAQRDMVRSLHAAGLVDASELPFMAQLEETA
jgi:hypothetical protein